MTDLIQERILRAQAIKNRLELAGYRLSDIDRLYGLKRCSAGNCLRHPYKDAEKAIADALGVHPMELWPERYDAATGDWLSPQPPANYRRPPAIRERRNGAVNSTKAA